VDIERLEYQIFKLAGVEFNPGSPQQLGELFFGRVQGGKNPNENILAKSFGFRAISWTNGGAPSTGADVLWKLSKMEFENTRKRQGVPA
jgi:DNA polymerase I-like protein with 3'-5' exonuclease and polymerase domains